MPHILLRNVDPALARAAAPRLVDRLVAAVGCERSWFTLDLMAAESLDTGAGARPLPMAEVLWFPRPAAMKAEVARILAEELRGEEPVLTAIFRDLSAEDYFENGRPA